MYVYVKNQYRNGAIIVLITILFIPTSQKKKDLITKDIATRTV